VGLSLLKMYFKDCKKYYQNIKLIPLSGGIRKAMNRVGTEIKNYFMRKLFTVALAVFASMQLFAQVQVNPQIGATFMTIKNPPAGVTYDGKVGVSLGSDFRFGERFQFQPGIHYVSSVTAYQTEGSEAVSGDVLFRNIKLKALVAYNFIDAGQFKIRANFGPSYDFLLSAKERDLDTDLKDDFKNGTFYLQGGLGVDFLFLTADVGYASGLTQTFAGEDAPDSNTAGLYFTVGVIIGTGKK
jgi:hypothetical protein